MKRFINLSKVEGVASRQAHADLPEGTFEREIGKEGFYGPRLLFIISIRPLDGLTGMVL
jgi:hypothetical protein